MDALNELVHPRDVIVNLPVEDGNRLTEVVLRVLIEEVGLRNRVVLTCEVIEAGLLAEALGLLIKLVARLINEPDALGGFNDDEADAAVHGAEAHTGLPVADVDSVHGHG